MSRDRVGGRPAAQKAPAVRRVNGEVWLQVVEAARRLGVSRGRIYHLTTSGRLKTHAFRGLLYVRDRDVQLYRVLRREHHRALVTATG